METARHRDGRGMREATDRDRFSDQIRLAGGVIVCDVYLVNDC